jgi:hypothetical protein
MKTVKSSFQRRLCQCKGLYFQALRIRRRRFENGRKAVVKTYFEGYAESCN